MRLIKITDLTNRYGLTSRSLRYYEQAGLIQSVRPEFEKYRFYDEENVERIKQIIVLRKMQIPIKDIIRIYESDDMSVVVQTFVDRIDAIDGEINSLSEMKRLTNEFLQTMVINGIKKISALPLLYEEMDRQLKAFNSIPPDAQRKPVTFEELSELSEKLGRPLDTVIYDLPPMRVLSSYLKKDPQTADAEGFSRFVQAGGIMPDAPGRHERFEFQGEAGDVGIRRVPDDFINNSGYLDYVFEGGLFAAASVYLDEDLGERFRTLIKSFDDNKYYQIDYADDGVLRHPAMLENLISPDDKRELVSLLVPVKKRMADPELFEKHREISPDAITIEEIEAANPVLWESDVPLENLTQTHIDNSYFEINEDGEAEFIGWVIRAVLKTNVSVKLPFRVDMEFRQSNKGKTGIVFYHSEDTGYVTGDIGSRGFGVNMGNGNEQMAEAVRFSQPVFRDRFHFPGRGAIAKGDWNHLTWIVGGKHLALIINGEIRYCGVDFPYMSLDLSREEACPVVIGAHGNDKIYFRSIRISQLAESQKNKLKEVELTMVTKQSNNIIPIIHRLVTDEYGENYWFNGCAKYVMECLSEPDFDYWFFAGLTGDVFTQHYSYAKYPGDAVSCYMMDENPKQFVKDTFAKCGYAANYISNRELSENTAMYLNTLTSYIDRGIPVITWGDAPSGLLGVFVGYEDYGKILLYITGNNNRPERVELDKALQCSHGWIFVGEKKENRPLAQIYREAIAALPQLFSIKTDNYCLGSEALRAWAADIESGRFDGMPPEEFDTWAHYTNYVCVLATNGSCCHEFLKRAEKLNPDMGFLDEVSALYRRTAEIWGGDRNRNDANSLEALGGGFNVTLDVLRNKQKCGKIAAKIRECAEITDEVVRVLEKGLSH